MAAKHTMLTAWFELNRAQPQPYKYTEIPNHFIFQTSTGKWRARKNKVWKNIIGRMYYISLRLLLLHTTGATSFDDLKTVNIYCDFFQRCMHNESPAW